MNRAKLSYFIDVGLIITFLLSFITGIIKFPVLTTYFSAIFRLIPSRYISDIHDWSGVVMGLLVLIHLVLHWKFLVVMTKNFFKKRSKK